jgi:hypothetical protein
MDENKNMPPLAYVGNISNDNSNGNITELPDVTRNDIENNDKLSDKSSKKSIWRFGNLKAHKELIQYSIHTLTGFTVLSFSIASISMFGPQSLNLSLLFLSIGMLSPSPRLKDK